MINQDKNAAVTCASFLRYGDVQGFTQPHSLKEYKVAKKWIRMDVSVPLPIPLSKSRYGIILQTIEGGVVSFSCIDWRSNWLQTVDKCREISQQFEAEVYIPMEVRK